MKLVLFGIWSLFSINPTHSIANECSGNPLGVSAACPKLHCDAEIRKLVGTWIGKSRVEIEGEKVLSESQLLFSELGCRTFEGGKSSFSIIGRRHEVIHPGKNSSERNSIKPVIVYLGHAPNIKTEGSEQFPFAEVRFYKRGEGQYLKLGNHSAEFKKLQAGQIAYFSGKAWTVTSNGRLVGASNFVMKSTFDPSTNDVRESVVYQSPNGDSKSGFEVTVFGVTSESIGSSRLERTMEKVDGKGGVLSIFERQSNGKLYREERLRIPSKLALSQFKSGEQITKQDFNSKMQKILIDDARKEQPLRLH